MSPDEQVCDFCSAQPVKWLYPARDFTSPTPIPNLRHGSRGDWAACDHCHDLIERGDRDGLARHAGKRYVRVYGLPKNQAPRLAYELRKMHDRFWSNREGAPQPVMTGGTS